MILNLAEIQYVQFGMIHVHYFYYFLFCMALVKLSTSEQVNHILRRITISQMNLIFWFMPKQYPFEKENICFFTWNTISYIETVNVIYKYKPMIYDSSNVMMIWYCETEYSTVCDEFNKYPDTTTLNISMFLCIINMNFPQVWDIRQNISHNS